MSISLEKVAEKYLVAKKLSAGTRKEYRSTVTKWLTWGHGVDVDRIERRHIRDFLDWVHDKASCAGQPIFARRASTQLARPSQVIIAPATSRRHYVQEPTDTENPASQRLEEADSTDRVVTSKYANYLWNVDLTTVPIGAGFWCSWLPFTLPQRWPLCWWLAVAVDHHSRRLMGFAVFAQEPSSIQVRSFLGRAIRTAGRAPKHLISDKGGQFWCDGFKAWCRRRDIRPRFGAVGKHGSVAVVERLILTMKQILRQLPLIPLRGDSFRREMVAITEWYNEHRPHMTFGGKTPNERYATRFPANRKPRIEPRPGWPRVSPCAKPWALVGGKLGQRFDTTVTFHAKRRHLPVVTLKRAA